MSSMFPRKVVRDIEEAQREIVPLLDVFYETLHVSEIFGSRLYDLQNYLTILVERGVYKSMELDSIIIAQNAVGQVISNLQH